MKQKHLYQLGSVISTTLRQRIGVLLIMRDECMSLKIRIGSDASQPCTWSGIKVVRPGLIQALAGLERLKE